MRRLAESAPELATEMRARKTCGAGQVLDAERFVVAGVDEVSRTQEVTLGRDDAHLPSARTAVRARRETDLERRLRIIRVGDRRPCRGEDGERMQGVVARIPEPVPDAWRDDDRVASSDLVLLSVDFELSRSGEDEDQLLLLGVHVPRRPVPRL
jgi:hypothetical protein